MFYFFIFNLNVKNRTVKDKVYKFNTKESHQIFIEPEGIEKDLVYPNGISTSLPFDVQIDLVRSIKGLENAHILRPGYAIEYDYYDPRALKMSLETKDIKGLFLLDKLMGLQAMRRQQPKD